MSITPDVKVLYKQNDIVFVSGDSIISETGRSINFKCQQGTIIHTFDTADGTTNYIVKIMIESVPVTFQFPFHNVYRSEEECAFNTRLKVRGWEQLVACDAVHARIQKGIAERTDFMGRIAAFTLSCLADLSLSSTIEIWDYENISGRAYGDRPIFADQIPHESRDPKQPSQQLPLQLKTLQTMPILRAPIVSILRLSKDLERSAIIIVCKSDDSEAVVKSQLQCIKNVGFFIIHDDNKTHEVHCEDIQPYTKKTRIIFVKANSICRYLCPTSSSRGPSPAAAGAGAGAAVAAAAVTVAAAAVAIAAPAASAASAASIKALAEWHTARGNASVSGSCDKSASVSGSCDKSASASAAISILPPPFCPPKSVFLCSHDEFKKFQTVVDSLPTVQKRALHDLRGCDDFTALIIYSILKNSKRKVQLLSEDNHLFEDFMLHYDVTIPFDLVMTELKSDSSSGPIPVYLSGIDISRVCDPNSERIFLSPADVRKLPDLWLRDSYFKPSQANSNGTFQVNNWWTLGDNSNLKMVLNQPVRPAGCSFKLPYLDSNGQPALNFEGKPYRNEDGTIVNIDNTNVPYVFENLGIWVPSSLGRNYYTNADGSIATITIHEFQPLYKKYLKYKKKYLLLKQKLEK